MVEDGATVIQESVDGVDPAEFLRQNNLHANGVSTVVWGSPCTDVSATGGYAPLPDSILTLEERDGQQKYGLTSAKVKSAIFMHLQDH